MRRCRAPVSGPAFSKLFIFPGFFADRRSVYRPVLALLAFCGGGSLAHAKDTQAHEAPRRPARNGTGTTTRIGRIKLAGALAVWLSTRVAQTARTGNPRQNDSSCAPDGKPLARPDQAR